MSLTALNVDWKNGASGGGGLPPIEKLTPLDDCIERPITCPSYVYTLLKRSYSTRTTMKPTNLYRWLEKPNLNFQKVYTHSQSSELP